MSDYEMTFKTPPAIKPPVTFKRKRETKEARERRLAWVDMRSRVLPHLHRAYLSGMHDGMSGLLSAETSYPNAIAPRYALGYSVGSRQRKETTR